MLCGTDRGHKYTLYFFLFAKGHVSHPKLWEWKVVKSQKLKSPRRLLIIRYYLSQNARLNKYLGWCAWTTKLGWQVGSWHQVDFGHITHVTGVATQGNCVNSEHVKSYMILYSGNNTKWTQYRESGTSKVSITVRKGSNSYYCVMLLFGVYCTHVH